MSSPVRCDPIAASRARFPLPRTGSIPQPNLTFNALAAEGSGDQSRRPSALLVMLNLFQHPWCLLARTGRVEKWTLKQVQGDESGMNALTTGTGSGSGFSNSTITKE